MAKAVKQQVNLNLKKSTNLYIKRQAKKEGKTKAQIVEDALKLYKAQTRDTV